MHDSLRYLPTLCLLLKKQKFQTYDGDELALT